MLYLRRGESGQLRPLGEQSVPAELCSTQSPETPQRGGGGEMGEKSGGEREGRERGGRERGGRERGGRERGGKREGGEGESEGEERGGREGDHVT